MSEKALISPDALNELLSLEDKHLPLAVLQVLLVKDTQRKSNVENYAKTLVGLDDEGLDKEWLRLLNLIVNNSIAAHGHPLDHVIPRELQPPEQHQEEVFKALETAAKQKSWGSNAFFYKNSDLSKALKLILSDREVVQKIFQHFNRKTIGRVILRNKGSQKLPDNVAELPAADISPDTVRVSRVSYRDGVRPSLEINAEADTFVLVLHELASAEVVIISFYPLPPRK